MTTQKRGARSIFASALVGLLIVVVCAGGISLLSGTDLLEAKGGQASNPGSTRTVNDSVGRQVAVPEKPQHIAALDAFSGNVCVMVGAGERLMGAPGGVMSNTLLQRLYPGLSGVEQLSGNSVNIETLIAAKVDVALVRKSLYEASDEMAKLDKMKIPYVVVDYENVDDQIKAIELVGTVCGKDSDEKTAKLTDYYRDTVALVEGKTAQIPEGGRVSVYHSINDPLLTDGAGSLGADWITRTGAVNVSATIQSTGAMGDYTATLEQVYVWVPDAIICNTADAAQTIRSNAQWAGLKAVSSESVYNMPVSAGRWGQRGDPETFLGMLWLGKTIYPELYSDIDLKTTVVSYYKDVLGLDIDDATYDAIISGEGLRTQGSGRGEGSGGGK